MLVEVEKDGYDDVGGKSSSGESGMLVLAVAVVMVDEEELVALVTY